MLTILVSISTLLTNQIPLSSAPVLPLYTAGCNFVDFSKLNPGDDAAQALARLDAHIEANPALTPLVVDSQHGLHSHRALRWSAFMNQGYSANVPVKINFDSPVHRVGLVLSNGLGIPILSAADWVYAKVSGLDSNGQVLESKTVPLSPVASSVLLNTDGDQIWSIVINYGNTNQEEELVSLGICRSGDEDSALPSTLSAMGEAGKISASFSTGASVESTRVRVRIKAGGSIWNEHVQQQFILVSKWTYFNQQSGEILHEETTNLDLAEIGQHDLCHPYVLVDLRHQWEPLTAEHEALSMISIGERVRIEAIRIPPHPEHSLHSSKRHRQPEANEVRTSLHSIDSVILERSIPNANIAAVYRVDGDTLARYYWENPPLDFEEGNKEHLAQWINEQPEMLPFFLQQALESATSSQKIRALYLLGLSDNKNIIWPLTPLLQDEDPSVVLMTQRLFAASSATIAEQLESDTCQNSLSTCTSFYAALCGDEE